MATTDTREGGVPSGVTPGAGDRAQTNALYPQASRFPQTPCKVGDAMGAKVVGGRGPSLNGAPAVKGGPQSSTPVP